MSRNLHDSHIHEKDFDPEAQASSSSQSSSSHHHHHYSHQPRALGSKLLRVATAIPTSLAKCLLQPFGVLGRNALMKLLALFASIYLMVVAVLYLFGGGDLIPIARYSSSSSSPSQAPVNTPSTGIERMHPDIPSRPDSKTDQSGLGSPFDPYKAYDAMYNNPATEQPFSWYDWVDLREVRQLWDASHGNGGTLDNIMWKGKDPFENVEFPPKKARTDVEQARNGRHFLDQFMLPPKKVVFLGRENNRIVNVISDKSKVSTTTSAVEKSQPTDKPEEKPKDEKPTEEKPEEKSKEEKPEDKPAPLSDERKQENEALEKDKQAEAKKLEEQDNKDKDKVEEPKEAESKSEADKKAEAEKLAQEDKQKRDYYQSADTLFPELVLPKLEDKITVDLPWESFLFNATETAIRIRAEHANDKEYIDHADMLDWAMERVEKSGKHFHEVPLKNAGAAGLHYDWRFFNKVRHGKDHEAFMHHLIRAWSMFAEQENILSLIAHGSLMGWYWDGMAMPWDADNDVQMPIQELDRFARKFNQTLVVEDPLEGNGRYFIDISPWYVERVRGNGNNVIDARFIDIRSGIYLDITGLAATGKGFDEKKANCKNWHTYRLDQLNPARRTMYEGVQVFVPNAYDTVLKQEYKNYQKNEFEDHMFSRVLRMWVPKGDCSKFKNQNKAVVNKELTFYGACNKKEIWAEYNLTKQVTLEHERELDLYSNLEQLQVPGDNEHGDVDPKKKQQLNANFAKVMDGYYPPLRYDPI